MKKIIKEPRCSYLGSGRNRHVFLLSSGRYVIKVPRNNDGIHDNITEARRYKYEKYFFYPMAACRLVPGSGYLLIMEYVSEVKYNKSFPFWVKSVDCQQVGYTLSGKLVAFDYGFF